MSLSNNLETIITWQEVCWKHQPICMKNQNHSSSKSQTLRRSSFTNKLHNHSRSNRDYPELSRSEYWKKKHRKYALSDVEGKTSGPSNVRQKTDTSLIGNTHCNSPKVKTKTFLAISLPYFVSIANSKAAAKVSRSHTTCNRPSAMITKTIPISKNILLWVKREIRAEYFLPLDVSPYFALNIKQIWANKWTFILPEMIRKLEGFW